MLRYLVATAGVWYRKYATKGRSRSCEQSQVYSADSTCSYANMSTHHIQLAVGDTIFRTEKHQIQL